MPQGDVYIVVPMHNRGEWVGPYSDLEAAQRQAAEYVATKSWLSCSVFKLVGTVAKPAPELHWHASEEKTGG